MLLALSTLAFAVPTTLNHTGRMLDATSGVPLAGSHDLTVSLYDAPGAATSVWSETMATDFDQGHFAVILGESTLNPLDTGLLGDSLWIGIAVDGAPELQRMPVNSVPYALFAETATNVSGGIVDASEIRIGGTPVIEADTVTLSSLSCATDQVALFDGSDWGCADTGGGTGPVAFSDLTNVPAGLDDGDDDTLASLACFGGETPTFNSGTSSWGCSPDRTLTGAEVDAFVTDGPLSLHPSTTLDGDMLLTTATTIDWSMLVNVPADLADGDDTTTSLPWSSITGIPADLLDGDDVVSSLPWSSISGIPGDIADGDDDVVGNLSCNNGELPRYNGTAWTCAALTASDVGAIDATGDAVLAGSIQIGDTAAVCNSGTDGSLRYTSSQRLEVCIEDTWVLLMGNQDGSSPANAATNCMTLHLDFPALGNAMYWIDPNGGSTADAFEVYCDMTTDGGGWTRTFVGVTGDTSTCGTNDKFQMTLDVVQGWGSGGEILATHFDSETVEPSGTPQDASKFTPGPYGDIFTMFQFSSPGENWTYANSPVFNLQNVYGTDFGNGIWWDHGNTGNKAHFCIGSTGLGCWYDRSANCGQIWHDQVWHSSGHAVELYVRP